MTSSPPSDTSLSLLDRLRRRLANCLGDGRLGLSGGMASWVRAGGEVRR